ncbi:MAG: hypothetical protein BWY63_00644 [Chloroflexi bacterium ADurb.Bin360]|nr:MAG: hypothetical protein BWY63_00644 [Chloroflexi bacterium ADurb.Bin360]
MLQPLQAKTQMDAAFVAHKGVNLIYDNRANTAEQLPSFRTGEQQVERFRRGDKDMRRLAQHRLPLALRCIAGAYGNTDFGQIHA